MELFVLARSVDDIEHGGCTSNRVSVATLYNWNILIQVNQYAILQSLKTSVGIDRLFVENIVAHGNLLVRV